jgi:hypothetical protein
VNALVRGRVRVLGTNRLVAEHGFDGHYQRVKLYVAEARQRLANDGDTESGLHGLHRRVRGRRRRPSPGRLGR